MCTLICNRARRHLVPKLCGISLTLNTRYSYNILLIKAVGCCRMNKTLKLLTGITRSYGRLPFHNQKARNNANAKQNTPEVYINTQFYSIDLLPSTDGEIKLVLLHLRFERSTAWDTKGFSREHCNRRVSMGILQINTEEKAKHKAWYM